jgi:DNA repair protein RadA/Sms
MKPKTVFRCSSCGHEESKWLGRCPQCGEWNSMLEEARAKGGERKAESARVARALTEIDASDASRVPTGFAEFDRVLGGGLARGATVLVGGEPGIGKSTLLLQLCARSGVKALYVTGEESAAQIRLRAERVGALSKLVEVASMTDLAAITRVLGESRPALAVVDSAQTMRAEEAGSIPGTVNQVKYCCVEIGDWARANDACALVVAHVTKDGAIAGPKAAEHAVDAVLRFERLEGPVRELSATKNRFGSAEEIGLFTMTERGLSEVADPAGMFMTRRKGEMPSGVAPAVTREGSRCFMVEIQALATPAKAGLTRVYSDRVDPQRVSRVAAILERHVGARFSDHDLYVNVAGGIRVSEPGVDLPLACALFSARSSLPLPPSVACAGELSLAGEVRVTNGMRRRAREARGLGFRSVYGPEDSDDGDAPEWERVRTIGDAIAAIFGKGGSGDR